jgi:two-component system, NarL family, nitrate/nitrite response regulator NarL
LRANQLISALHDVAARNAANRQIKFSTREDQILRLLLDGKTNKAIAGILAITENTVKHYMSILMQKLNARNRLEVVIAAQKLEQNLNSGERVH